MIKLLIKYSLLISIIWTVTIFVLCFTPGRFIPTTSWLELLSFDKFVHASIFLVLVACWLSHFYAKNKLSINLKWLLVLLCTAYGGLLEIMQATIFSQRSGDWLDFIANSVGCLVGLALFNKYKNRLNHLLALSFSRLNKLQ